MTGNKAMAEGKNAHVVRKWFGHDHIPQRFANAVNRFALATLSPFLNFHRPCLFASEQRDARGKVRRYYRREDVMTPYEKLKSLPYAEQYLRPGLTFAALDKLAHATTDLEANLQANRARDALFQAIGQAIPVAA